MEIQRAPDGSLRTAVAESVRHAVWKRYAGTCQGCGSQSNLQFDYIIPVSLGGTNTEQNLQIIRRGLQQKEGHERRLESNATRVEVTAR